MSYEQYTLNVISQLPEFKGRSLKKYNLAGQDYVGVWGNEPFEITFKNNTYQKVQVKLSLDGTDILTGKPADTTTIGDMWVVHGYGTLTLKAWPETNKGGAQFIFTSAEKSVAVNTHGDVSSRGVIAAAVYTEGYVEPPRRLNYDFSYGGPTFGGNFGSGTAVGGIRALETQIICDTNDSSSGVENWSGSPGAAAGTLTSVPCSFNASDSRRKTKSLQSLAAVGAGQQVEQNIQTVSGLVKPTFAQVVKMKYMWWNELCEELKNHGVQPSSGSGFPGDEKRIMSIGSTPRLGQWNPPAFPRQEFSRF